MKATRWSKTGYECPACGDWHDLSETPIDEVLHAQEETR